MIAKCIRLIDKLLFCGSNACRKAYLRFKYPGLKIDRRTTIERNCKIICTDGGKMEITDSVISSGVYLFADDHANVRIDRAFIGRYTHIISKIAVEIRSGASIAEMVVIRDQDHVIHPDLAAAGEYAYHTAPVIIGAQSWIASKATILKGVTIGDHAIIAASAVVTKSVPSNEVWGGIPAKFIKRN